MEIYLIRHTIPKVEKGICYGQSDLNLGETFPKEYEFLKNNLPEQFDAIFTSPLKRCRLLAEKFRTDNYFIDNRLLELNFGEWEMKIWDEIDQVQLNEWMKDFVNAKVPQGESFIDLSKRADSFIEDLQQMSFNKTLIVSHGGIIRYWIAKILEIPLTNAFKIPIDYTSITLIRFQNDACNYSLIELNRNYKVLNLH